VPRHCYLLVEGPHDVAFAGRFLKLRKLKMKTTLNTVSPFWYEGGRLIPRSFPVNRQGDFHKRTGIPSFFEDAEVSVAIHNGGGLENLPSFLEESIKILGGVQTLSAVGVLLDADSDESPAQRFAQLKRDTPMLGMLNSLGDVNEIGGVRLGVFVLPNNRDIGTMETVLSQCAEAVYPELLSLANRYIQEVKSDPKYVKELSKESASLKAIIGVMANVFRPGKSNEVSIQDQDWISNKSAAVEGVQLFDSFLGELLGLQTPPPKIDPPQG